ncbi:MAG: ABC transporter substrate-binding protein [Geitlerinemataceae cyanobacterium]
MSRAAFSRRCDRGTRRSRVGYADVCPTRPVGSIGLTRLILALCCALAIALSAAPAAIAQPFDPPYDELVEEETLEAAPATGIDAIVERGVLRVGMPKNDNFPFYGLDDSGEMEGLDSDFAIGLAGVLGVDLEYVRDYDNHNAVIAAVADGEVDCGIAKFSRTPKRGMKVTFSQPYLKFRQALLVNQRALVQYEAKGLDPSRVFDNELEDTIAVLGGTSYVSFAKQLFPKAELLELDTWDEVVAAVIDREALAAFRDEVEVRSIALNAPELAFQLKSVLIADSNDGKGVAVARDNPLLKEVANLYIDNFARPVEADAVLERIAAALDSETETAE